MSYLKGDVDSKNLKGRKLTPKMESFINAYFSDANFNAVEAVRKSDYNSKQAPHIMAGQLMAHPLISREIEKRLEKRRQKSEVKAEILIQKLMEIIDRTEENNPNAALRAIELAGKSIALWKERQEISGPDGEAIKHEQRVRENVTDFTSRIASLATRAGKSNVVELPVRRGEGGA